MDVDSNAPSRRGALAGLSPLLGTFAALLITGIAAWWGATIYLDNNASTGAPSAAATPAAGTSGATQGSNTPSSTTATSIPSTASQPTPQPTTATTATAPTPTTAPSPQPSVPAPPTQIGSVLFDNKSADLDEQDRQQLQAALTAIMADASRIVRASGHADAAGEAEGNMQLSQRRAAAVAAYLASIGVPTGRIVVDWFGEDRPIASNDTPEGRASNRRVDLRLESKGATP